MHGCTRNPDPLGGSVKEVRSLADSHEMHSLLGLGFGILPALSSLIVSSKSLRVRSS